MMHVEKLLNEKITSNEIQIHISSVNSYCATTYTKNQNHHIKSITGHQKLKKLIIIKICNSKRRIGIICKKART